MDKDKQRLYRWGEALVEDWIKAPELAIGTIARQPPLVAASLAAVVMTHLINLDRDVEAGDPATFRRRLIEAATESPRTFSRQRLAGELESIAGELDRFQTLTIDSEHAAAIFRRAAEVLQSAEGIVQILSRDPDGFEAIIKPA